MNWLDMRGGYEVIRVPNAGGRAIGCGMAGALAAGFAVTAGAVRAVTTRGEAFCMVVLIVCPKASWPTGNIAPIATSTEN